MKLILNNYIIFVAILCIMIPIDVYAVDFKDHTGYIPNWAVSSGEFQALMTCANMEYGTIDQKWCLEYSGYYNDKISKELDELENQNYQSEEQDYLNPISNSDYIPQYNQRLFESPKIVSYNTLSYTNELYGFFISPPKNWSRVENAELLGGEQAAPVGFYSNQANPTYTANFIIVYANLGSSYFDLLRLSSDKDVLDGFTDGYAMSDINSKISSKKIESFIDGYKITIDSVHTMKLDEKKFATLQKETVVFLLESGEMYSLIFASMSDDFNNNVGEFRKSSQTFHVGQIEFEKVPEKQTISDSESICGKGTIFENGKCVVEPSYSNTSTSGGCLIATATFDSELAPQVQRLREIRDNALLATHSGTIFMTGFNQVYYSFSPTIADWERENLVFKEAVKIGITPLLSSLSIMSFADSEHEVLGYGVGVILLNVGMYFVAPIIIVTKVSKKIRKSR